LSIIEAKVIYYIYRAIRSLLFYSGKKVITALRFAIRLFASSTPTSGQVAAHRYRRKRGVHIKRPSNYGIMFILL